MKYLAPGLVKKEKLDHLIQNFTSIRSEILIMALHDHLVQGQPLKLVDETTEGVTLSNLKRSLKTLNEKAAAIEWHKEFDWPQYQNLKKLAADNEIP